MKPPVLNVSLPVIEKGGVMSQALRQYVQALAIGVPYVGTGSPESVLQAPLYSLYIDETTPTAPVQYRKMQADIAGDKTRGWTAL